MGEGIPSKEESKDKNPTALKNISGKKPDKSKSKKPQEEPKPVNNSEETSIVLMKKVHKDIKEPLISIEVDIERNI